MREPRARGFGSDQEGATALEYALLASLIAVVIAAAVALLGQTVLGLVQQVSF